MAKKEKTKAQMLKEVDGLVTGFDERLQRLELEFGKDRPEEYLANTQYLISTLRNTMNAVTQHEMALQKAAYEHGMMAKFIEEKELIDEFRNWATDLEKQSKKKQEEQVAKQMQAMEKAKKERLKELESEEKKEE